MVDTNKWENVARIFKGYFQIYVSSTAYAYQHLVEMREETNANYAVHYSTSGQKKLASVGHDSKYTIRLDDTAELYDTAATPTDTKSISYFVDKILDNSIPEIEFEGVEESDAAANKFIRSRFKGGVVGTNKTRNTTTGTYERELIIKITEKVRVQRMAS